MLVILVLDPLVLVGAGSIDAVSTKTTVVSLMLVPLVLVPLILVY